MARTVKRTAQFRRDFKRAKRSVHSGHLDATLLETLELLAADVPLPPRFVDHPMKGQYCDCPDCHTRPDLVLVYRKRDEDILELIRIGTHAQPAI
ncbi:MAG: type II toxin-antitoxin system YafQ family toxin [Gammaproteobacteria bacterium]|nr:type II toxin-antitoxin system YafQ family toxin [Gammaproteobacteria bacterium]MXW51479.1 type II toxin-antitoxin system YafQ family toxin [Gammaproteobacteria bacterium]MYE52300.1 type II toxin-antitoxin system YafQ family toxin [Gammaproteobacteria bacterium]MYF50146.1 type II toxin-antitoxin system YafQ family toxin [Gammaproteobacteria bacterium]MYH17310.1 type II toxin-antitoxin system YafQ family toxin [Gammaproteobacteria bacterium]